jgi:hypothetical protein
MALSCCAVLYDGYVHPRCPTLPTYGTSTVRVPAVALSWLLGSQGIMPNAECYPIELILIIAAVLRTCVLIYPNKEQKTERQKPNLNLNSTSTSTIVPTALFSLRESVKL